MCDYSLEMYASRPAQASENYLTTRFPSGSVGLAVPGDCSTAVCVQYDMRLKLKGLSTELQNRCDVSDEEEVVFAKLEHGAYRDGVRFSNGKEISLQLLGIGVSVSIVSLMEKLMAGMGQEPVDCIVSSDESNVSVERILEPAE
jgi:hypothetical protein